MFKQRNTTNRNNRFSRFGKAPSQRGRFSSGSPRQSFGGGGGPRHSFGGGATGSRPQRSGPSRSRWNIKKVDVSRFINKDVVAPLPVPKFVPQHSFSDFRVSEALKKNIFAKGYTTPTPIQDKTIPHILEGKDVVGIANTGTGKTAAFLIPLIQKVLLNGKERVLIVVPTRELALQIDEELRAFVRGMRIFSVVCVGGVSIGKQIAGLRRENHFVIGTPGRLKDLVERKVLNLGMFRSVVLDEADRMLDMGFIADIRRLLSLIPKERHTLFFSATQSKEILGLVNSFLKEPMHVSVKMHDTPKTIEQNVVRVEQGKTKLDTLHNLLSQADFTKVLIFGRTKWGVEALSKSLCKRGLKVDSMHGGKNQSRRQKALSMFRCGAIQALVATDVAARGLDIAGISHVINYELPATEDDYIHRIGRTGRGESKGKAITFVE